MKVLLVCAAFPPHGKGGGPAASRMIAHSLAEHNDLVVITVSDTYEQWYDGKIRVKSIGSPNLYWNYWKPHSRLAKVVWHILENFNPLAFFRILKEIRRERPDLLATVSVENVNVATWLAARLLGIPTVHFIQSYFLLCWRGSMFRQRENCSSQCLSCKLVTIGRKRLSLCVDLVAAEAASTLKIHFDHGYFKGAASFVAPGMLAGVPTSLRTDRRADGPLRVRLHRPSDLQQGGTSDSSGGKEALRTRPDRRHHSGRWRTGLSGRIDCGIPGNPSLIRGMGGAFGLL